MHFARCRVAPDGQVFACLRQLVVDGLVALVGGVVKEVQGLDLGLVGQRRHLSHTGVALADLGRVLAVEVGGVGDEHVGLADELSQPIQVLRVTEGRFQRVDLVVRQVADRATLVPYPLAQAVVRVAEPHGLDVEGADVERFLMQVAKVHAGAKRQQHLLQQGDGLAVIDEQEFHWTFSATGGNGPGTDWQMSVGCVSITTLLRRERVRSRQCKGTSLHPAARELRYYFQY